MWAVGGLGPVDGRRSASRRAATDRGRHGGPGPGGGRGGGGAGRSARAVGKRGGDEASLAHRGRRAPARTPAPGDARAAPGGGGPGPSRGKARRRRRAAAAFACGRRPRGGRPPRRVGGGRPHLSRGSGGKRAVAGGRRAAAEGGGGSAALAVGSVRVILWGAVERDNKTRENLTFRCHEASCLSMP